MPEVATFPRTSPEIQGVPSKAILAFLGAVERNIRDLNSLIVLRHGAVIAEGYWEPYGPSNPHMLFSLSKSFTSTAIGLLVSERRLTVDDLVLDLFADKAPADPNPSNNLKAMRVRDLLTMTTGHNTEPPRPFGEAAASWMSVFLGHPVEHQPGTHFLYNSMATYMLSAIVQRLTGQRLVDYLQPRIFEPLGIQNPTWESSPEGINTGGWGLSITTLDIARFGQLYLQRGVWQGKQLIPESWVAAATSRQVPNAPNANPDWEQGYGYQFWRCRHGAYRGDGAFGQFCVVLPEQDTVLAITSGVGNMQAVLDLVWEHLLPALGPDQLPDATATTAELSNRLAGLRLPLASGRLSSPRATALSGREYQLQDNLDGVESVRFDFAADGGILTIKNDRGEEQITCGSAHWVRGQVTTLGSPRALGTEASVAKVAASGAWKDDETYVAEICWYETPFRRTLTCHFDGSEVSIEQTMNVGFGTQQPPRLVGKAGT